MAQFNLPPIKGFQEIERFYDSILPHLAAGTTEGASFELDDIGFLPPEVLLPLLCASRHWKAMTSKPVEWKVKNDDILRYLERMDIFSVLGDCITVPHLPADLWSRGSSSNLMEVRLLSPDLEQNNLIDVPNVLATARNLLLGRLTAERLGATCTLLSEITQNVTHSASQGYALMQIYKAGTGRRVHIAVGDTGFGIPGTLRMRYPNTGQPSDYIEKSLESGVSSRSVSNGLGLYQVQQMVRNGGGTLTIRSDTAMLQILDGRIHKWDGLAPFPGTQVFITIWGRHEKGDWDYLLSVK